MFVQGCRGTADVQASWILPHQGQWEQDWLHSLVSVSVCRIKDFFFYMFTLTLSVQQFNSPVHFCVLTHQCWGPLQAFHDWCTGRRSVHHSWGEQASPVSAGPGGLSSQESHHTFQRGADCRLRTGVEMFFSFHKSHTYSTVIQNIIDL